LGRRLLAHAETIARDLGRREMRLFTNALLVENIALYERVGYRVTEVEDLGFARVTHMRKGLG
jgi:GNAT superfamily N-acetyltransferase